MIFSEDEIRLALDMKDRGLNWLPAPGHYVWDEGGLIEAPSPFQERVYYILDLQHFLRRAVTVDNLQAQMVWLPTWRDARLILKHMGIMNETIAERLRKEKALEFERELLTLYRIVLEHL